jgi:hypothetical protein
MILRARTRSYRISFSAAMHCRFCSIVPTEIRTHSAKL